MIRQLFHEYVDDTTLVITSGLEHESVNEILHDIKNKYVLDEYRLTHINVAKQELSEILPKYNKVFLYMIGVHMSTGFIMPDIPVRVIQKTVQSFRKNHSFRHGQRFFSKM